MRPTIETIAALPGIVVVRQSRIVDGYLDTLTEKNYGALRIGSVIADWSGRDTKAQIEVSDAEASDIQQGVIMNTIGA